ncbi:outer membrane beta-barrel protein [Chitinophaga barathri]|uniref:Outer membrane protein beta-barrel domain-containing protein n=1 Tax=Chitinophaga barathri TaxID=1647451 RepID=A0A3N4MLW9_9BACT|nr:outer membrane beta-barrel protein [Chitinophaga barathri]RPD43066.1 hypothetical protein EG028_01885 [Chitinophaga barathri]
MRIFAIVMLIVLFHGNAAAQRMGYAPLKGIVTDSATSQPLEAATVSVFTAADSALVSYTITNRRGEFTIQNVPKARPCKIVISFKGLQNYEQEFIIPPESKELIIRTIGLPRQVTTLDEVIVSRLRPPVVVKKDTLEFSAGAFKTSVNGVVEDLLRQLPGVEVDIDGNITVNGKPVAKITVDGRDFFGTDVRLTTKNLPRDIIDKIQVVDARSNEQRFTGATPTGNSKVLNLVLKKDKKKGVFGRASVGAGTADRYEASTNLNQFDSKTQLSLIGYVNNTNNNGGGAVPLSALGSTTPARIRKSGIGLNAGLVATPKLKLNGSYFFNADMQRSLIETERSNILPDTAYNFRSVADNHTRTTGHSATFQLELRPDSLTELTIGGQYQHSGSRPNVLTSGANTTISGTKINESANHLFSKSVTTNFSSMLFMGRKFKKRGRIFALNLNFSNNSNNGDDYNLSSINENLQGTAQQTVIDQYVKISGGGPTVALSVAWTEPLLPRWSLRLAYNLSMTRSISNRDAFRKDTVTGGYILADHAFSNHFTSRFLSQSPMASVQYNGERTILEIGAGLQGNQLRSAAGGGLPDLEQRVTNFQPAAILMRRFGDAASVTLRYNGFSRQPSLQQLQPVPDITNPLYVRHGNPELKPSFTHNVSAEIQQNRGASYWSGALAYTGSTNLIVEETWLDSVQHTRPINSDGNFSLSGNLNYSASWRRGASAIRFSIGTSVFSNVNVSYSNKFENRFRILGLAPRLSMQYSFKEKITIQPSVSVAYSATRYSLPMSDKVTSTTMTGAVFAQFNWSPRLVIENTFNYQYNQRDGGGNPATAAVWNASVNYYFTRNRKWILRLAGFDLLNRNALFQNSITPVYTETTTAELLRRYYLASITWKIDNL